MPRSPLRRLCTLSATLGLAAVCAVAHAQAVAPGSGASQNPQQSYSLLGPAPSLAVFGQRAANSFGYTVNSVANDSWDILTSPRYIGELPGLLEEPKVDYTLAGAAALMGAGFGMDKIMQANLHSMAPGTATDLQNISYDSISVTTGLMWVYGLYTGDARAQDYAIAAGEGAGIATLADIGIKAAFGQLRPYQNHRNNFAFFRGGASFVSGDVTPMFGLAAGVSEYLNNAWYASVPIYSLALLDGFGRMGHNAHWFDDVLGAALLGAGTTELIIYLHKQRETSGPTFQIVPVSPPSNAPQSGASFGMGVALAW